MATIMQLSFLVFGAAVFCYTAHATTYTAASCNTSAVQSAINSAAEGDTVKIPAGNCAWTSGITIASKGITLQGAGSGRIIAYDNGQTSLTVGMGTKSLAIAGYSPGFSSASISTGDTLQLIMNNNLADTMTGTVTSFSGGSLNMNITSSTGSGTAKRWLVATVPPSTTTIVANNSNAPLFAITEDTGFHTNWSGIKIQAGNGDSQYITIKYTSGGLPVLIHDCWIQNTGGSVDNVDISTTRGVMWNCSFQGSSGNAGQLVTNSAFRIKVDSPASGQNSWTQQSYWGSSDTNGNENFYVETNDFHSFQAASDLDSNARTVWRYNLMDHSTLATHGADTSDYGQRYFEFYNNTGVFYGYSDGTTLNMANGWVGLVRGGTFVVHHNTLPALQSQDYGTKADVLMLVMNLQRNGGPNPCWGASHTSAGQYYPAPRQVGFGWVTGAGTANYPNDGVNNSLTDSVTYVGDSEPAYIWGNSRLPLANTSVEDYGLGNSDSCAAGADSSANYIKLNRDYYNGSTTKPGYTPYTYPHPLTQVSGQQTPSPPTNLQGTAH
jgi:hypothetical protein